MNQHPSGAGLSTVIMSFLLTTYYNVIMSWALFYLAYSFSPSLPWEVSSTSGHTVVSVTWGDFR